MIDQCCDNGAEGRSDNWPPGGLHRVPRTLPTSAWCVLFTGKVRTVNLWRHTNGDRAGGGLQVLALVPTVELTFPSTVGRAERDNGSVAWFARVPRDACNGRVAVKCECVRSTWKMCLIEKVCLVTFYYLSSAGHVFPRGIMGNVVP
ncbi:hypothetical protein F2P81_024167 [Scophthalmus maximus]|uniref:Uncharacterized protein n=1 Tax=Scophthalmus maximus TaxID=52904 RepID=A0A6A4RTA1_SCOMX|nr:hypothetical protein F2P81_024167 [Scophthalmus maximus]